MGIDRITPAARPRLRGKARIGARGRAAIAFFVAGTACATGLALVLSQIVPLGPTTPVAVPLAGAPSPVTSAAMRAPVAGDAGLGLGLRDRFGDGLGAPERRLAGLAAPVDPPAVPPTLRIVAPRLSAIPPVAGRTPSAGPAEPEIRVVTGPPPLRPPTRPGSAAPAADGSGILLAGLRPQARPSVPGVAPLPDDLPADLSAPEAEAAPVLAAAGPSTAPLTAPRARPRPAGLAGLVQVARADPEAMLSLVTPALARGAAEAPAARPSEDRLPDPAALPRAAAADPCTDRLAGAIPRRDRGAPPGSAFFAGLGGAAGTDRDRRIVAQIGAGNVPSFLRDLRPVALTGDGVQIVLCVMPDYLALGSDADFVRVPLGLRAAMDVADRFDMLLPTARMVDAIYAQADVRLRPQPMDPGPQMASTGYFLRHNAMVEAQLASAGGRPGLLVSGHKKDLVLTNRLARSPGRVAIYGWHRAGGQAIQPLSTVHGADYADYSHGVRLVSRTAYLNGRPIDLGALLSDDRYAGILNSEGPMQAAVLRVAAAR